MALSVHIPKEITEYRERIIGDFSGRQLLSLLATVLVLGLSYVILVLTLHIPMNIYPYIASVLVVPCMAVGFYRKHGMPFEIYIQLLYRHYCLKNKLSWAVELDYLTEGDEDIVVRKVKKVKIRRKKEKEGVKRTRKRIQRKIKEAKAEYRAAVRKERKNKDNST